MMRIRIKRVAKTLVILAVMLVMFSMKMLFERGNFNRSFLRLQHFKTENITNEVGVREDHIATLQASFMETKPRSRFEFSHRKAKQFSLESELMSSHTSKTAINTTCLRLGTRFSTYDRCICQKGWLGASCNMPEALHYSYSLKKEGRRRLKLRSGTARRVIYATPFNHEFEMIETLLNEHYELVDVFIFLESSYTAFGIRKPLRLLPRLHRGYLKKFAPKIMYLYLDHFPTGARKVGFKADSYLRGYLDIKGLPNIHNLRDDDLFLVFDIDEIPTREFMAFFKFHDGYPEPFGVRLRWSVFGFFWKYDRPTQVTVGCTVGMLKTVYNNDSNIIRAIHYGLDPNLMPNLESYKKSHLVQSWFMGEDRYLAGWHCSSCLKPEGIRVKFMSAQNADLPRWGSFPEKMDLKYIISLVREGKWFDGGKIPGADINSESFYAPQHILENPDRYEYILVNPYPYYPLLSNNSVTHDMRQTNYRQTR